MKQLLITYGTRPEYIKIKPLLEEMKKHNFSFKTLYTGQHDDIAPKCSDYNFTMTKYEGNRLDSIIKNCLSIPEIVFKNIDYILVQGDTTSAVGLALSAFNKGIKIIHLEAGLRTYDTQNPFPEEINRRIISSISKIHLCPTEKNKENLLKENINCNDIHVVGNTGLDNLRNISSSDLSYENKILITFHRRENHELISTWFAKINDLAINYPNYDFILPLHPNPIIHKHKSLLPAVNVIDPLNHHELINLLIKCSLVITDSGGLQEECSFLNKKCLICRKVTERTESLNKSSFLVRSPWDLLKQFAMHINSIKIEFACPYGDGFSAEQICEILRTTLSKNKFSINKI